VSELKPLVNTISLLFKFRASLLIWATAFNDMKITKIERRMWRCLHMCNITNDLNCKK